MGDDFELNQRLKHVEEEVAGLKGDMDEVKRTNAEQNLILNEMNDHMKVMAEIMKAWNDMKGFGSIAVFISKILKVVAVVVGFIVAVAVLIKTGRWVL